MKNNKLERIKIVVNWLKTNSEYDNQKKIADKMGYKRANTISDILTEKVNLSPIFVTSFANAFGVNENWLETGEGSMFLTTSDKTKALAQETGKPHEEKGIFQKVAGLFKKIPQPDKEDLMTFNEIVEWEEDLIRRYEELKKKNQDKKQ